MLLTTVIHHRWILQCLAPSRSSGLIPGGRPRGRPAKGLLRGQPQALADRIGATSLCMTDGQRATIRSTRWCICSM